jgi:hypothetical protein
MKNRQVNTSENRNIKRAVESARVCRKIKEKWGNRNRVRLT